MYSASSSGSSELVCNVSTLLITLKGHNLGFNFPCLSKRTNPFQGETLKASLYLQPQSNRLLFISALLFCLSRAACIHLLNLNDFLVVFLYLSLGRCVELLHPQAQQTVGANDIFYKPWIWIRKYFDLWDSFMITVSNRPNKVTTPAIEAIRVPSVESEHSRFARMILSKGMKKARTLMVVIRLSCSKHRNDICLHMGDSDYAIVIH
ncbi:hypothetical protein Tco_0851649 [Tanacetum coccineum]